MYSAVGVYSTRTSVCSDAGWPSSGVVCQNPVITFAAAHALSSSTLPSITGTSWAIAASAATDPAGGASGGDANVGTVRTASTAQRTSGKIRIIELIRERVAISLQRRALRTSAECRLLRAPGTQTDRLRDSSTAPDRCADHRPCSRRG